MMVFHTYVSLPGRVYFIGGATVPGTGKYKGNMFLHEAINPTGPKTQGFTMQNDKRILSPNCKFMYFTQSHNQIVFIKLSGILPNLVNYFTQSHNQTILNPYKKNPRFHMEAQDNTLKNNCPIRSCHFKGVH